MNELSRPIVHWARLKLISRHRQIYLSGMAGERRLYRSRRDRVLGGVLGGLAEYLGLDPNMARLLFVALVLLGVFTSQGWLCLFLVAMYLAAWVLLPEGEPQGSAGGPIDLRPVARLALKGIALVLGLAVAAFGFFLLISALATPLAWLFASVVEPATAWLHGVVMTVGVDVIKGASGAVLIALGLAAMYLALKG